MLELPMCLFEWDEEKERENFRKHGVLFADAASVFDDPYRLAEPDDRFDYDELRWWTIGMAQDRCMMLFVVYTTRDDGTEAIRIISARHAVRCGTARPMRNHTNGGSMAIVRFRKDEILPLSEDRMAELRELAKRPDDEIDCSDIPELTEENAARMVRVSDFPSVKDAMREALRLYELHKQKQATTV